MITANIDDYAKHLLSAQTVAIFAGRAITEGNKVFKLSPVAVVALQSAFYKEVEVRLEKNMILGQNSTVGHIISVFGATALTHILFEKVIEVIGQDLTGLSKEDLKIISAETIALLIQQNIFPGNQ